MLIRFNVKNYLSFSAREDGSTEEFSMIAGKVRSKKEHLYDDGNIKLLKFAAVYGANASGKSNLVKAMDFMRQTVLMGLPDGCTSQYCRMKEENKNLPSYFEVEIKLGNRYYTYGFEVILSLKHFVSEWLYELKANNNDKLIFSRDIDNTTFDFGSDLKVEGLWNKLTNYAEDIQDDGNVLLLSLLNQNKKNLYQQYREIAVIQDVFEWFKSQLDINFPNRPISDYSYMVRKDNIEEIYRIISAFGTGITGFEIIEVSPDKMVAALPDPVKPIFLNNLEKHITEMKQNASLNGFSVVMRGSQAFFVLEVSKDEEMNCKTIQFSHGSRKVLFELGEESDGTLRLLDLLEVLLCKEGKTYVIDEVDRCLHPSLTYKFIEIFLQIAEQNGVQLIVTTHESRLMDFDLLRRDEIWFVDKNNSGESNIYSLEEYNARFDQKIDKAYLEGRYGGVPIFSTVFPIKEG
ncbi:MAG: ATP/GTP-binding protein [Firmicutes bacterium]|nr:ATP/GTP-binding protein [Bacillota bacterium]